MAGLGTNSKTDTAEISRGSSTHITRFNFVSNSQRNEQLVNAVQEDQILWDLRRDDYKCKGQVKDFAWHNVSAMVGLEGKKG